MPSPVRLLRLAACACLVAAAGALPKLALDTDIGSDFDDTHALLYLLSRSKPADPARLFDFQLVQCSSFNTTARALIAAKILFDLDRFDVPVAIGLYTGENDVPQLPVVGDFSLADFTAAGGVLYHGTDFLAGLMQAATPTDPLFIVEIAPATSLGGIVKAQPSLAANVITTAMRGSVYHGYGNSSAPEAEYNVYVNVSASQAMYASSWLSPLMTAPLDTSGLLRCSTPEFDDLLAAAASPAHDHMYAEVLVKNYRVWCGCSPTRGATSDVLYDAQAAYQSSFYAKHWAAGGGSLPSIPAIWLQQLHMSVNASGFTIIDPAGGMPVWPAVSFPEGLDADTHVVCGSLFDWVIAA